MLIASKVGNKQISVNGNNYLITKEGTEVNEKDVGEVLDTKYPIYCPAKQKFVDKHIFYKKMRR